MSFITGAKSLCKRLQNQVNLDFNKIVVEVIKGNEVT